MRTGRITILLGLVPLLLLVSACSAASSGGGATPITIGIDDTMSGSLATNGIGHLAGANVAIAEVNAAGGVAGHPLKIVQVDDQATPAEAAKGIRQLKDQGVTIAIAATTTPSCQAIAELLGPLGMVGLTPGCSTPSLTQPGGGLQPNFFRTAANNNQIVGAAAVEVCKLGVKRVDSVEFDFVTGKDAIDRLSTLVTKCGLTLGNRTKVPLDATDLQPYIQSALSNAAPDSAQNSALVTWIFGAGETALLKSGTPAGLFSKYKATYFTSTDFISAAVQPLGSALPKVHSISQYWSGAFDTPMNKSFIAAYKKANQDKEPGTAEHGGYMTTNAIIAALKKTNGDQTADKVRAALEGLSFDDPQGKLTIDATTHQVALNMAVAEWSGQGAKLAEVVTAAQIEAASK